jgi:hypothetical protein
VSDISVPSKFVSFKSLFKLSSSLHDVVSVEERRMRNDARTEIAQTGPCAACVGSTACSVVRRALMIDGVEDELDLEGDLEGVKVFGVVMKLATRMEMRV